MPNINSRNSVRLISEKGALPLFLIIAVVALIAFFVVASTFNFKNSLFSSLFPKPGSFASEPVETPPPITNLVKNPGCTTSKSSWVTWQGILSQSSTGVNDNISCQVTFNKTGNAYGMDDNPATVLNPKQGDQYLASAWVKSANAVGKPIQVIIKQQGGTKPASSAAGTFILTNTWQQISVISQVDAPDRTSLEILLVQLSATSTTSSANSFQADDITLSLQYPPISNPKDPDNFVSNTGCELNTSGWGSWHGIASRTTSIAYSGVASCQVKLTTTDSTYTLDDEGSSVSSPAQGATYSASAWVRTDSPIRGQKASLILREWKNSVIFKNVESPMLLSRNWQQLTNKITVDPGVTAVDIYIAQYNAATGDSFQADDIGLKLTPAPTL